MTTTELEWWEKPYPGGPMVTVPGFPRPLYPPDAASDGKKPSVDGPDVIAYKRTVSRAGRWPWQAFDDTYSDAFAHGKPGGNVGDSGVAGVQRQGGIEPGSGWVGERTFNLLRSIRIPEGLPHAGDPAMDATAQTLLAEAWKMFGGHEASGSIRERALARAITQLGTLENPNGSNRTKYGDWYGWQGCPWCAIFVTWAYETANASTGGSYAFVQGTRYAYCPYIYNDAKAHRYGLELTTKPIPGDVILYDFDGSEYDHTGLFEDGDAKAWKAIEGNTVPDGGAGSQTNGGGVWRRSRSKSNVVKVAFVRVNA